MNLSDITSQIARLNTPEHLAACLSFVDLTSLSGTDTDPKIETMIRKVNEFPQHFPELPNVAAICVYPSFTEIVRKNLTAPAVQLAVVGAGFPASQTFLKIKKDECRLAVEAGADEVDIVLSLNYFLSGAYEKAAQEISEIKAVMGSAHLKVILESGALASAEAISHASRLSIEAGADFIKTSTGKTEPAATPEAAMIMCQAILDHYKKTGQRIGFKPAGGIATVEDALCYYAIVLHILGPDWLSPKLFRIGASRLANNLLSAIKKTTVHYF